MWVRKRLVHSCRYAALPHFTNTVPLPPAPATGPCHPPHRALALAAGAGLLPLCPLNLLQERLVLSHRRQHGAQVNACQVSTQQAPGATSTLQKV